MKVKKKLKTVETSLVPAAAGTIAGVNDLSDDQMKERAEAGGQAFLFMKLAQATSGSVTGPSKAAIGDFTIGQDDRNLGTSIILIPIVRSFRAQLWGKKGKDKGKILAESRTPGSPAWKRVEAGDGGEFGYEFGFYHPEDRCYTIFAFGKWWARQIGDAIALGLKHKYGCAFTLESFVTPGKNGNPPLAKFRAKPAEKTYTLPKSVETLRAKYLEQNKKAQEEEAVAEKEALAPANAPER